MAYKSTYQRALESFERATDHATPVERKLLDRLQSERPDMGRLKLTSRRMCLVLLANAYQGVGLHRRGLLPERGVDTQGNRPSSP